MRWPVLALVAALLACGPKADGGDDVDDGPTTEGEASTGGTAADDGGDDRTNATGGADDAGDGGSGGGAMACVEDVEAGCEGYCTLLADCQGVDDVDRCTLDCVNDVRASEPACQAAQCDFFACMGGLDCDGFVSDACSAQQAAVDDACSDAATCSIAIGEEGGCSYTCGSSSLGCRAQGCVCTEDGKEVATCDTPAACDDLDGLATIAADCCGF